MWCANLLLLLLPLLAAVTPPRAPPTSLVLASWNLQWLVAPSTAHASRLACDAGRRAALPCDVARDIARDSADWGRLRHYVRALDADVIAFQEVENAQVALRIFHGYRICIGEDHGVQQVGFAVRPFIPHHCGPHFTGLTVGGRGRSGAVLRLEPEGSPPLTLMAVHLKSGCAESPLDSAGVACVLLNAQADALAEWILLQRELGSPYILLGDFNRAGPDPADAFWRRLDAAAGGALRNAAAGTSFRNCFIGQPYTRYIDHILLDPALEGVPGPGGFARHGYSARDALRYRLSDHCPVSIRLSLNRERPAAPAVLYRRAD